jgi:hypothetical protein
MEKTTTEPLRGSRAAERDHVLLSATLVIRDGSHPVRVRDLSRIGAHVVAEEALPSGVDAIFKRGGTFAAARIVWSKGKEAGLEFYHEPD